jgi:hypothetical protein
MPYSAALTKSLTKDARMCANDICCTGFHVRGGARLWGQLLSSHRLQPEAAVQALQDVQVTLADSGPHQRAGRAPTRACFHAGAPTSQGTCAPLE